MEWDLYVDESGSFDKDQRCLVGGFVCPHGSVSEAKMAIWKSEILENPLVQETIHDFGRWEYDHCRINRVQTKRKKAIRGALQLIIVKEYIKKIEALGGKVIIFDNPSGSYNSDNTTNFLTV